MINQYGVPPLQVFRRMGLGRIVDGRVRVVAGFRIRWWYPDTGRAVIPLVVNARVIRVHNSEAVEA